VADSSHAQTASGIQLSEQQQRALTEFAADTRPALLFGATGSGKTEVYLHAAADVLARNPDSQVLVMVPEINLTPQLQARFEERFAHLGKERVVAMHSGLTPAQRLKSWLSAHSGHARLILGTRMAVLASMPRPCRVPSLAGSRRCRLIARGVSGDAGLSHAVTGELAVNGDRQIPAPDHG
jgi:primosomal protein N' (replication factor Y)